MNQIWTAKREVKSESTEHLWTEQHWNHTWPWTLKDCHGSLFPSCDFLKPRTAMQLPQSAKCFGNLHPVKKWNCMPACPPFVHIQSSRPCKAIIILGFEIDWITGDVPAVPSHIFKPRISLFLLNPSSCRSALPLETEWTYGCHLFFFGVTCFDLRAVCLKLAWNWHRDSQSSPVPGQAVPWKIVDSWCFREGFFDIFWHLLTLEALLCTVARWLILSGGVAHKGPYIGVNSEAGQSFFKTKRSFSRHARVLQPSSSNLIL